MADQEFELTAKLRIRTVTAGDAKDLQAYCFPNNTVEEVSEALKNNLAQINRKEMYRIVAEASGHAVGNIQLQRSKLDNEIGELSQLTVSPPFRKFDVATKLIQVIEQIAVENGIKTLRIELPKSENAIIEAYHNWGFAERPVVTLQKEVAPADEEPTTDEEAPSAVSGKQQELSM